MKDLITIVVPCYNEEESLPYFIDKIRSVEKEIKDADFEIIFINDGSQDRTMPIIKKYVKKYDNIKYISFSKNFGKEAAMYAGLKKSKGDYLVCIDADLQHPPELIITMYRIIKKENYDCVGARSIKRVNYSLIRKKLTQIFYKVINKLSYVDMQPNATDFRLMNRTMINSILSLRENHRYTKGIYSFVGFRTKWIEYEDNERIAGNTKWNIKNLFSYAFTGIISFSTKLLYIAPFFGIILMALTLICGSTLFIIGILNVHLIKYEYLLILLFLLLSSISLVFIGIISIYISQIHLETKKRPLYIIRENNIKNNENIENKQEQYI